ncbi:MAG: excinuclease ABC subunit UvrA, partial [Candidatus Obscuribacterales bacterium]|nr:excinuclease ABC subunit UvrA [Candidatus Obscuribacterales bacterium]
IAAWPGAWQGKNLIDILAVLGYDVDKPWKDLSKKDREWILFTEEKPVVTVHAIREAHRIQRPYQGTYQSAATYVKHTFATTGSATMRKRVAKFMETTDCTECNGKRLSSKALAVKFAGYDIAELAQMPLSQLSKILATAPELKESSQGSPNPGESAEVAELIGNDLIERIALLSEIGLDYLAMDRATPTLSSGELQRLRLSTQLKSGLFGVVYLLDEPSAGLHPADSEALLKMLKNLLEGGNSLFVVEHDMEMVRQADWIVDIGPGAGEGGGTLLYSGPVEGILSASNSITKKYIYPEKTNALRKARESKSWLKLKGASKNNLKSIEVSFPLGALTAVTGVSGSGKSTLVSQVLTDSILANLGIETAIEEDADGIEISTDSDQSIAELEGMDSIKRLVCVDQKPIGRTPRSNLATYTGLFDNIRQKFAATAEAKSKGFNAGRFSFNVVGGRCATCEGEGYVSVELMFLPSVYTPCTSCHGTRYNAETLEVTYKGLNIAQVLDMTVDAACDFFTEIPAVSRALITLRGVGLGYLRIGQAATELSGGEAQRIKLATELQRVQKGNTIYLLDEPTTGLHPADIEKLMEQLHSLVDAGNTVIMVEHDMEVISEADWVIDMGPGAGAQGGTVVACGTPSELSKNKKSRTAPYLSRHLNNHC